MSLRLTRLSLSLVLAAALVSGCKKSVEGVYIQTTQSRLDMMKENFATQGQTREGFVKAVVDTPKLFGYRLTLESGGKAILEWTRFGGPSGPITDRRGEGTWQRDKTSLTVQSSGQEKRLLRCTIDPDLIRCSTEGIRTELLFARM